MKEGARQEEIAAEGGEIDRDKIELDREQVVEVLRVLVVLMVFRLVCLARALETLSFGWKILESVHSNV